MAVAVLDLVFRKHTPREATSYLPRYPHLAIPQTPHNMPSTNVVQSAAPSIEERLAETREKFLRYVNALSSAIMLDEFRLTRHRAKRRDAQFESE
jgi:hypothetical protein